MGPDYNSLLSFAGYFDQQVFDPAQLLNGEAIRFRPYLLKERLDRREPIRILTGSGNRIFRDLLVRRYDWIVVSIPQ
jgi:hypothetical protein